MKSERRSHSSATARRLRRLLSRSTVLLPIVFTVTPVVPNVAAPVDDNVPVTPVFSAIATPAFVNVALLVPPVTVAVVVPVSELVVPVMVFVVPVMVLVAPTAPMVLLAPTRLRCRRGQRVVDLGCTGNG